jgi:EAL domain-containing protein (putative c-di-GMP-specific phosphodiesterase class I)
MAEVLQPDAPASVAFLEHYPETGEGAHRLLLDHFPFCIGRNASAHYCINSRHVSKEHAQLVCDAGLILIRDLGSTNGTFVNGQRVQEAVLNHGDIVHVAHKEFRFGRDAFAQTGEFVNTDQASGPLPVSAIQNAEYLKEMLWRESVRTLFQPIVDLRTKEAIGHEALGRGTHDKLSASPAYLFSVAAQCSLAPELSRLFRRIAVRDADGLPPGSRVFLNLHPAELRDGGFFKSLACVPEALGGGRQVIIEFHEEAVTDRAAMRRLRDQLSALGIGLAYDDFGAGQSRLSELAEVPPDFVKLDKSLIHDLHESPGRQELVRALARLAGDLGIRIIAEGVEIPEEAAVCLNLGCHFGQGYFFGRPQPVAAAARVETNGGATRVMPTLDEKLLGR